MLDGATSPLPSVHVGHETLVKINVVETEISRLSGFFFGSDSKLLSAKANGAIPTSSTGRIVESSPKEREHGFG